MGIPSVSAGKESACSAGDLDSNPVLGRSPGGGIGSPVQYCWPGEPHAQRSLAGYSPWGRKELDMTERPSTAQRAFCSSSFHKKAEIRISSMAYQVSSRGWARIQISWLSTSQVFL